MSRKLSGPALWALVVVVGAAGAGVAADAPYAGTWKIQARQPGSDQPLVIVEVQEKASGPKVSLVDAFPVLKGAEVSATRGDDGSLKVTAKVAQGTATFVGYPPKGEAAPKVMLGTLSFGGPATYARWERTEDKEIDAKAGAKPSEDVAALVKAMRAQDAKEKRQGLEEVAEKHPDDMLGQQARMLLMGLLADEGAGEKDVKAVADKVVSFAAAHGPVLKGQTVLQMAGALARGKGTGALAAGYAREARAALPADAPPSQQLPVLKVLQTALKKTDRADELKEVDALIAKLDKALDEEFLKTNIPFKVEKVAREKGDRVALVELFTGAQCPPCVAADVAFDALAEAYAPKDVVLLQYHLHIPGPDPLTNADGEKRGQYYPLQGTPTVVVNGKEGPPLGGSRGMARDSFDKAKEAIARAQEEGSPVKIALNASRQGDDILIRAEVTGVKKPEAKKDDKKDEEKKEEGDKAEPKVRLRFALVEDVVRYPGRNGQRFHHHVVRGLPGGVEGFAIKGGGIKQELKVSVAELRKSLEDYLASANKRRPFIDDERPLELKNLKVAAFVQDDATKEVLQAAQVDLHAAK